MVPVDPLTSNQVEVIRGPATLRFGSQAIGGVVESTNNRIPTYIPTRGISAEFRGAGTSVDSGIDGATLLDAGAATLRCMLMCSAAQGKTIASQVIPISCRPIRRTRPTRRNLAILMDISRTLQRTATVERSAPIYFQ